MDFDYAEDSAISMFDEDGNEAGYRILTTKKDGDNLYMLAEEDSQASESEVLIFKCITGGSSEPDEMVFELLEESHECFDLAFSLFKEDMDNLGIEY